MKPSFCLFIFTFYLLFLVSCKRSETLTVVKDTDSSENTSYQSKSDYLTMATIWFQKSGEARACYYQTYYFAQMMLDMKIGEIDPENSRPLAIILDIDETVLDNSPFEAKCVKAEMAYSKENWKEWSELGSARALPGTVDFLNYAKSKGVTAFYISNRKPDEMTATLKNMTDLGFPFAEEKYLLLKTEESGKKQRREIVQKDYDVLLYIGDNLADFNELFEKRGDDLGVGQVEKHKDEFGTKFIILPNPMYGDWEKAVYKNNFEFSDFQKDSLRKAVLEIY